MKRLRWSLTAFFLMASYTGIAWAQVPPGVEAELRKLGQAVYPGCTAKLYRPFMPMNDYNTYWPPEAAAPNTKIKLYPGIALSRDVPFGKHDVIVTDGFTGNVVVKVMEGTADYLMGEIRGAIRSRPWYLAAGVALLPAFARVRKQVDYREYGAGPLLGVNGLVFIGHGRSDARAIVSALRVAREAAQSGMLEAIRDVAPARAEAGAGGSG